ncbi:MAG: glycosyltransferase family 39 protein [Lachnospiraceae bacterium]|nr:glycosyltransferase family 39 protein [Lachnospiraceae bacterium]
MKRLFSQKNSLLLLVLLIGFALRLFMIGNIPGNRAMYVDELYSGYEAYSLLHFGTDSHGYVNPVYLSAWGSGQSVMQSLLIVPCMILFGVNSLSVRLPQALLGCLTLVAFYFFTKKIRDERFALVATALLSIMPWHIMMSRWALDCNFLPAFVLFGALFLVKATEQSKYLLISMLFFGLSLYCYAAAWPVMPLFIGGSLLYLLKIKMIKPDRFLFGGLGILACLALPLILFVCVNSGLMEEIRGVISIPRLYHFRSDELSLSPRVLLRRFSDTILMFKAQDDGRVSNITPGYGLYYHFSNILIILGIGISCFSLRKEKKYPLEGLVWIWFICGGILGLFIEVVFNRINLIHLPIIYFLSVGVFTISERFGEKARYFFVILFAGSLIGFMSYYATEYDDNVAKLYQDGAQEAISFAEREWGKKTEEGKESKIYLMDVSPVYAMFYAPVPTDAFIETVEYDKEGLSRELPMRFTHYDNENTVRSWKEEILIADCKYTEDDLFVVSTERSDWIEELKLDGFEILYFSNVAVAYN